MKSRTLKIYFGSLIAVVVVLAAVALRPTPLAGFSPDDLATSVNGGALSITLEPCKRRGDAWSCVVTEDGGSSAVRYDVEDPDWWGCWHAERAGPTSPGRSPRTLDGCITLLDHM